MENFRSKSIFWIELNKIVPNPYQPRIEFSEDKLKGLADSIKQYGVLQPIVVSRVEKDTPEGGLTSFYEIIAGERRFRASKIAGLESIPAIIREGYQTDREKLELAIIENLQREDLNPVDKARSFERLVHEFGLKHAEVAAKMGKSREYVSNSLRLLSLPEQMLSALNTGIISEGHTRPLLMLKGRVEEQMTLFNDITTKKLTVREAEKIARSIATDKIRRRKFDFDPEIKDIENKLADSLGTKVSIEKKQVGGKLTIEYFSNDDLQKILDAVKNNSIGGSSPVFANPLASPDIPIEDKLESNLANDSKSKFSQEVQSDLKDLQTEIDNLAESPNMQKEIENSEKNEDGYKPHYSSSDDIEYDTQAFSTLSQKPDVEKDISYVKDKTSFEKPGGDSINSDKSYQAFLASKNRKIEQENSTYSENIEESIQDVDIENDINRPNMIGGGLGFSTIDTDIEKSEEELEIKSEVDMIMSGSSFIPNSENIDNPKTQDVDQDNDDIYNINKFSI